MVVLALHDMEDADAGSCSFSVSASLDSLDEQLSTWARPPSLGVGLWDRLPLASSSSLLSHAAPPLAVRRAPRVAVLLPLLLPASFSSLPLRSPLSPTVPPAAIGECKLRVLPDVKLTSR